MSRTDPLLPDDDALAISVGIALTRGGVPLGPVRILNREANPYESRARSEVVTCRLDDGGELRLLCKYVVSNADSSELAPYEAEVYRKVLHEWAVPTSFVGVCPAATTGTALLCFKYLDHSPPLAEIGDPALMRLAAGWIGRFHALSDSRTGDCATAFLKRYDAAFYLEQARRAIGYAGDLRERPWLEPLAERFEPFVTEVFSARATVVHGDYHPHNLLVHGGAIHPIDWELAGLDLGEADLACLLDGEDEGTTRDCEGEYQRARWPEGSIDFERTLGAARLCLYFQNLAARPEWTTDPEGMWYSRKLRRRGEQLGLIQGG